MDQKDKKEIIYLPIEDIIPNRFQPRLAFDERELNELSNSIIKYGVIQPIVVRKTGEKYEIIAGERRYKASTLAGLSKIPAIITNTDDNTSAEIALLENIQRKNLTVIEEAKSFKKLMDRGFTQESLALKLGISQSSIANKIRLLNLPKRVQDALLFNKISERHARSLLTINDEGKQLELLDRIINDKLTVKQTEDEISAFLNKDLPKEENIVIDTMPEIVSIPDLDKPEVVNVPERIELPHEIENEEPELVNEINVYDSIPSEPEVVDINVIHEEPELVDINVIREEETVENEIKEEPELVREINVYDSIPSEPELVNVNVVEEPKVNEIPRYNPFLTNVVNEEKPSIVRENHFAKTVSSIRDCITSLNMGDKITTTELDLDGKYQIIIEIDKNDL